MDKWNEFKKFVDKAVDECSKEVDVNLLFESRPSDITGDMIKGNEYYAHANFKPSDINKFIACVERVADRPILTREYGKKCVTVYYPLGTEEAKRVTHSGIVVMSIREADRLIEKML